MLRRRVSDCVLCVDRVWEVTQFYVMFVTSGFTDDVVA